MYIAAQGAGKVKVYELWYGNSMEQHRFQAGVSREQRAFEELIRAKGAMVLPDLAQVRGDLPASYSSKITCLGCQQCELGGPVHQPVRALALVEHSRGVRYASSWVPSS